MIGAEALTRNLEQKKASAQDQRQAQAKQQSPMAAAAAATQANQSRPDDVDTQYLLLYKPSGELQEGHAHHPLYDLYEELLNAELPMYEVIKYEEEAMDFLEYTMSLFNKGYLKKTVGARLPFNTVSKKELDVGKSGSIFSTNKPTHPPK